MLRFLKSLWDLIVYIAAIFVLTWLIVHYVGQRTEVNGTSMYPTLESVDQLITDKLSYRFRSPERFEIIVFPYEHRANTYYIKRIIGLPGETVRIDESGTIYINGKALTENYGSEPISYAGLAGQEVRLGADEYFVLGDNRNNSEDSRFGDVGNIQRQDIIGRAWLRIYPWKRFGMVE